MKSCRIAERINNEWRIQMSTYLVDFENVGVGGMDGVEKLSDHDRVVIFMESRRRPSRLSAILRLLLPGQRSDILRWIKQERISWIFSSPATAAT